MDYTTTKKRVSTLMSPLWLAFWILLAASVWRQSLAQDEELLEPEKAFAFSAKRTADNEISLRWDIADGYYMYLDKFKFEANGVALGEPEYPEGKIKDDDFFGKVATYEKKVVIKLPIAGDYTGETFSITAWGQGCNEPIGVCYPPQSNTIEFNTPLAALQAGQSSSDDAQDETVKLAQGAEQVPTMDAADTTPATNSSVDELRGLLGNLNAGQQEFLDVDQAFRLDVSANDDNDIVFHFNVEPGYYLYQNSLKFEATDEAVSVGRYSLPPGEPKTDEHFGDVIVYYGSFDVRVPVEGERAELLNMKVSYQGCAEKGICYAPVEKKYQLAMAVPVAGEALTEQIAATDLDAANAEQDETLVEEGWNKEVSSQDISAIDTKETRSVFDFRSYFKDYQFDRAFFGFLLAAFGTGLLLTFTPCVLPMIPIVSSIVVGQGGGKARGGWLSLLYVLGTAITYGIIGWIAGATGEQLQAYFQNIYAIGAISLLFVVMALSMFGLFAIQMPSFMQSRIQEKTAGMGGSAFMVFVLGIVSALIVGACVSPLLISVLSVSLVQGDPVLGAAMMFIMALGMGVVLVLVGVGSSWLLPKAGMWMDYVKYAFGVMLIAVAIYLLGAIPAVPVQLLWAALFIVLSVYLGAIQPLPEAANRWRYFAKGIGIILLVWGVIGLLGGLQGNRSIMHPLPDNMFAGGVASTNTQQNTSLAHVEFIRVKNLDELTILRERAVMESKPLLLDYYADWCTDCIRMEETTFKDAGVINALENYVLVQVDVTDPKDEDGKALKSEFNIYGPPATVIFGKDGKELGDEFRFYGYRSVAELLALLNKVKT